MAQHPRDHLALLILWLLLFSTGNALPACAPSWEKLFQEASFRLQVVG